MGRSWHLLAVGVIAEYGWLPGLHRAGPSAPLDEVFSCDANDCTSIAGIAGAVRGPHHALGVPAGRGGRGGAGDVVATGLRHVRRAVAVNHGVPFTTARRTCFSPVTKIGRAHV